MFDKNDIQIDGRRVLVKQWDGSHFNWVCVAEFHHNPNVNLKPDLLAQKFVRMISK